MLEIQKTIMNKDGVRLFFDDIIENESCYITKLDNKFGVVNSEKIEIFKPLYDEVIPINYGFYIVRIKQSYGLINPNGVLIIPVEYNYISNICKEEMVEIHSDKKVGFANVYKVYQIEPKYDSAEFPFSHGIIKVKKDNKYGFIDKKGNEFIPVKYDWISNFYEGIAKVCIGYKYGYITQKGEELLKPEYDEASGFNFGFGFAKKSNCFICINNTGEEIFCLNPSLGLVRSKDGFQRIDNNSFDEYIKLDCGLSIVKQNGIYSCISDDNTVVVDFL